MNLSTKKSFLSLLIATAFLTGCQNEQNSTSDNQASTVAASTMAPKNTNLPYGRSKKIAADPIVVEPVAIEPIVADPVVVEPVAVEPIVADPVVVEPVAVEPIVTDPVVVEPVAVEPIITDPVVVEPVAIEPIITDPVAVEPQPVVVTCVAGNANTEGLVADKATGAGLPNVQVNIGGCTTTTDAQGFYKLANITSNDRAVVTFDAAGYARSSAVIQIDQYLEGTSTISPNYLEFALEKYTDTNTGDSQNEMNWRVAYGFGLYIPGGIYTDAAGNAYSGQVTARRVYRKQAENSKDVAFPGTYRGKNSNGAIVPFVSYGFVVIDLTDANGSALGVSDNITLTFPATGATDDIIPLWYYDYDRGLWIEEGYAQLQADNSYMGTISHPGAWSLSKPVDTPAGVFRGRILNEDGTPAGDVRVHAVGDNWVSSDLSTEADGSFEIEVIPDSSFQLEAYNYKDKYKAVYNDIIPAVASGEIVED